MDKKDFNIEFWKALHNDCIPKSTLEEMIKDIEGMKIPQQAKFAKPYNIALTRVIEIIIRDLTREGIERLKTLKHKEHNQALDETLNIKSLN